MGARHGLAPAALVLALTGAVGAARAEDATPQPGESDLAFARRALRLPDAADPHVTAADWSGVRTLIVDYETDPGDPDRAERPLVALRRLPSGAYHLVQVTLGEQEGGTPDVAAVGFARAGRTAAKDLIVILAWTQQHYDVEGTLYEVRIFGPPGPGQGAAPLLKISQRFGVGCDCDYRVGGSKHFRFKTIAAVKAGLRQLGY